eukprot:2777225-Pyramimonas_sp.AAC.1
MQDIPQASNIMTSIYAYEWKFVKNDNDEMGRAIGLLLVLRGSWASKPSTRKLPQERRGGRVGDCSRARQRASSNGSLLPSTSTRRS